MRFHIPIKLPSLNPILHQHWSKITRLKKKQKEATAYAMVGKDIPDTPLLVIITRLGPRKLDDDNLAGACKYVRDKIAEKVGIDDGSDKYTWVYQQKTSKSYGVDVEIVTR